MDGHSRKDGHSYDVAALHKGAPQAGVRRAAVHPGARRGARRAQGGTAFHYFTFQLTLSGFCSCDPTRGQL